MSKEKIVNLLILIILIFSVASVFYFYPLLPEKVITHWNWRGEADGWSSKNFQAIFFPALLIFMWFLFKFLPYIDPRARGYKEFKLPYLIMQFSILLFLALVYLLSNLINIGYDISLSWIMMTMMGVLFMVMGILLPRIKPNWFVGIRTPWTLSSESVWLKTHRYGAKIFVLAGLVFIISPYLPSELAAYIFVFNMLLIFSTMVYSYFVFRSEKKGDRLQYKII